MAAWSQSLAHRQMLHRTDRIFAKGQQQPCVNALHPSKTYIMPKHEFGHSYLAAKPDLAEDTCPTFLACYDERTSGLADMDIVNSSGQILNLCPRCQYSATSKTAGGISKD